MWQSLFLILILFGSTAFAQTQEKKDAYKFQEYQTFDVKNVRKTYTAFCEELAETEWIGWIVNFGTPKEIAARVGKLAKDFNCGKASPTPRIIFVDGGKIGKTRTEFWIVRPGAEPPKPTSQS